jgi:hypothetical protein
MAKSRRKGRADGPRRPSDARHLDMFDVKEGLQVVGISSLLGVSSMAVLTVGVIVIERAVFSGGIDLKEVLLVLFPMVTSLAGAMIGFLSRK